MRLRLRRRRAPSWQSSTHPPGANGRTAVPSGREAGRGDPRAARLSSGPGGDSFRHPTLAEELDSERSLLVASGIECLVESRADGIGPSAGSATNPALRIGTTAGTRPSWAGAPAARPGRDGDILQRPGAARAPCAGGDPERLRPRPAWGGARQDRRGPSPSGRALSAPNYVPRPMPRLGEPSALSWGTGLSETARLRRSSKPYGLRNPRYTCPASNATSAIARSTCRSLARETASALNLSHQYMGTPVSRSVARATAARTANSFCPALNRDRSCFASTRISRFRKTCHGCVNHSKSRRPQMVRCRSTEPTSVQRRAAISAGAIAVAAAAPRCSVRTQNRWPKTCLSAGTYMTVTVTTSTATQAATDQCSVFSVADAGVGGVAPCLPVARARIRHGRQSAQPLHAFVSIEERHDEARWSPALGRERPPVHVERDEDSVCPRCLQIQVLDVHPISRLEPHRRGARLHAGLVEQIPNRQTGPPNR